ncbi:hypothetical protein N657DRAFT_358391 [Parathielavia appendiculata]|uniref:Uncharacterized protein n=1 Tax=Parathielavia appendiculata TaxID=2587402 RepID=A0AAN6U2K4_9PEZI|nr:hypothetical protein N657DRAFT_358391 [Parathielavia appendiculata]
MKPSVSLLALLVAFAAGAYGQEHLNDGAPALIERDEAFNATADGVEFDLDDVEDHLELSTLEKRKACSRHRKQGDVCKGRVLAKMNSRHNWYVHHWTSMCLCCDNSLRCSRPCSYQKKSGHCCAREKNGDYGVQVTSSTKTGEDCGYCFSGNCRAE